MPAPLLNLVLGPDQGVETIHAIAAIAFYTLLVRGRVERALAHEVIVTDQSLKSCRPPFSRTVRVACQGDVVVPGVEHGPEGVKISLGRLSAGVDEENQRPMAVNDFDHAADNVVYLGGMEQAVVRGYGQLGAGVLPALFLVQLHPAASNKLIWPSTPACTFGAALGGVSFLTLGLAALEPVLDT